MPVKRKKPNLYNILFWTILMVIIMIVVVMKEHTFAAYVTILIYWCGVLIMLIDALRKQMRYNPYSYNTIYYSGFALFVTSIIISTALLLYAYRMHPDVYQIGTAISMLTGSASTYIFLSFPFIVVFALALSVSNVVLIRHEGRSFTNILGILLSFVLVFGVIFLFIISYSASGSIYEVFMRDMVTHSLLCLFFYYECMLIGTIFANGFAATYKPAFDQDYMIILGCAIRQDGTPKPLLAGRIDKALSFATQQEEMTGKALTFIPSGGKGSDEVISEAESIAGYLKARGIPAERIILEDRSRNTFENMKYSKEIIDRVDPNAHVTFATTNYHVFRSGIFARRNKLQAVGIGAKTKWYFWPNAAIREFIGLLTQHRGKQILVVLGILLSYYALTYMSYFVFG